MKIFEEFTFSLPKLEKRKRFFCYQCQVNMKVDQIVNLSLTFLWNCWRS